MQNVLKQIEEMYIINEQNKKILENLMLEIQSGTETIIIENSNPLNFTCQLTPVEILTEIEKYYDSVDSKTSLIEFIRNIMNFIKRQKNMSE